jgi:hypothetical protein
VQNKASLAANATQHDIIQETAARQRQEDKAAKQLERVQMQMAERVMPVIMEINGLLNGWIAMVKVRQPQSCEGHKLGCYNSESPMGSAGAAP